MFGHWFIQMLLHCLLNNNTTGLYISNTFSLSCKQITSTLSLVDMCSGLKNTFWVIHWCSQLQIPFHCIVSFFIALFLSSVTDCSFSFFDRSCMFQEKRDVHPEAELFSPEELPFSVCWTRKKRTGFQQPLSFLIFWTKQTHNSYREWNCCRCFLHCAIFGGSCVWLESNYDRRFGAFSDFFFFFCQVCSMFRNCTDLDNNTQPPLFGNIGQAPFEEWTRKYFDL